MPHLKSTCSICPYRNNSIPYTLIENEKLTKALLFKTNLACPQCKLRPLKFKYGKNKSFALPRRITFGNINSIVKKHLKEGDHGNVEIEELHCGQTYDYRTISTSKFVIKTRHKHRCDKCPNCKHIRRGKTTYMDGVIPVIKDSYGIVESVCNSDPATKGEKEEGECVICMERTADGQRCQVCNKIYHKACIRQWITKQNCCPHCRSAIIKNVVFYFFETKSFYYFGDGPKIERDDDDDNEDDDNEDENADNENTNNEDDEDYDEDDYDFYDEYDVSLFRYRTPEDGEPEEDSTDDNLIAYMLPSNQEDFTSDDELIVAILYNLF